MSLVMRAVVLVGVSATAIVWVAMWYFWFGVDNSRYLKKAIWFLVLFWLPPFSAIYCLTVYRRSGVFVQNATSR
jgi:hypothetical protein